MGILGTRTLLGPGRSVRNLPVPSASSVLLDRLYGMSANQTILPLISDIHQWIARLCSPPLCDLCRFARGCAAELLACESNSMYYHGERSRAGPLRRAPTRARFEALLEGKPGRGAR
jgi:hypothetical protein